MGRTTRTGRIPLICCAAILTCTLAIADSPWLYGIHWWGYTQGLPVDSNPATMLDCPTYGGWTVETVITHSASWWGPGYFTRLYQDLYNNKNVTPITRIDYDWGQTVPSPSNPDYAGWPATCVSAVNTLGSYAHIWIIGNEPNILGEGNGWPDNKITPSGYATIYRNVRSAIHGSASPSPAGEHRVLIAGPSPGGVIAGVRWMDGNEWLGQVIDNIPSSEIDGFAIHSYGGSLADFHNTYASQLALIDSKGLSDRPVYITEWNKVSSEADMAQFVRDSFADLNSWNQTPGNHDVICMCWFVYDADQQAGGGWDSFSIEYWRGAGEPLGSYGDIYTAFSQTVDLRYPAGQQGSTPDPDDASFVTHNIPSVMEPGETRQVSITVRNTGSNTWTGTGAANLYRLGAGSSGTGNPHNNEFLWSNFANGGFSNSVTDQRAYLGGTVAPSSEATFTFDITAPASTGAYWFEARMVHEGVTWFGDTLSAQVSVQIQVVTENVLDNPGFEIGDLTSWTSWGMVDGVQTGPWFAGIEAHSGTYFEGSAANYGSKDGGLYQRVRAQPGVGCAASVWSNTYWAEGTAYATRSRVGLDPAGGVSPTSPSIVWSAWDTNPVSGGTPPWREVSVAGTASAHWVTIFLEYQQDGVGGDEWHINCFDDASLSPQGAVVSTGSFAAGWNLASVPLDVAGMSVGDAFYDLTQAGNDLANAMYRYAPGSGYEIYPGAFGAVEPARGYWLHLTAGAENTIWAAPFPAAHQVALAGGWNLIGHPHEDATLWSVCQVSDGVQTKSLADAVAAGWVDPTAYYYQAGAYRTVRPDGSGDDDSLRPWYGYWVLANVAGLSLIIA